MLNVIGIAIIWQTVQRCIIFLCDSYISQHGLRFNPQKTGCITAGKHRLVSQPQWTIKDRQLKVTDTFSYLGAVLGNGGSAELCESKDPSGQKCPQIAASSRTSYQWTGPIGRNACVFAWSPAMPKLRGACHRPFNNWTTRPWHDTLEPNQMVAGVVYVLSIQPLLRALGVQRIPAMRDHQSANMLKRCLSGSSASSTFYWSLIHNRDIDVTRTLVNKLNLVDNPISRGFFGNTRMFFYDIGNDGLSDSVRFLLHNMKNDNFRILQNIRYVDF